MSDATVPGVSVRNDLAQAFSDAALARVRAFVSRDSAFQDSAAPSAASGDPVDIVDLSGHAKSVLERNKSDQLVADRLDMLLAISKIDRELEAKRSGSNASNSGTGVSDPSPSKQNAKWQSRNRLVNQYLTSLSRSAKLPY